MAKTDSELKAELLSMAKAGAAKPAANSELGQALTRFMPKYPDLAYAMEWKGWDHFLNTGKKPGTIERSGELRKTIARLDELGERIEADAFGTEDFEDLKDLVNCYRNYVVAQIERASKGL